MSGAVNKVDSPFSSALCAGRLFPPDARNLPAGVIEMIASQTGVLPLPIDGYPQNEKTRFEHLERIRQHLGFVRCDATQRDWLLNHLTGIAQAMPRSEGLHQTIPMAQTGKVRPPGRTTVAIKLRPLAWPRCKAHMGPDERISVRQVDR